MMLTQRRTSLTAAAPPRRLWPAGWRASGRAEPITVRDRRYGYAPWRFLHRGDLHRVCRVDAVRDQGGPAPRRYFTVCCVDGERHTLFQDLQVGTWHIEL